MDDKKLLISLRYNLECTIHAPGSPGCQQSNVGTLDALCHKKNSSPAFVVLNGTGIYNES
ncbi:hypothetical protein T03_14664 [Trichinella britovi]|uniref:Uncharacterized protein n=1 Tax=Trichinella britovi TaxID=45882 RepID=A0A0V1DFS9_TRIBR|nr:hypothetical protein T03_14664 [Trichinella britovi]